MNKKELSQALAERLGCARVDALRFVDAFTDVVIEECAAGSSVRLVGFGTFRTKVQSARTARNPKTGEPIAVPKRCVPHFAAGEIFKSTVA